MVPPADNKPTEMNMLARLTTHEAVCAERYGGILTSLTSMATRIGRLEMLVWASAGSLIIGMATLIVTLVLKLPALR